MTQRPSFPAALDDISTREDDANDLSLKRYLALGFGFLGLIVGGAVVWATTAEIAGAVIAPATIVVDSNAKTVQHLEGGIVAEVNVRDGMHVEAGDVLVRLQDAETDAKINALIGQVREMSVEKARLEAERDGEPTLNLPPQMADQANLPMVARILEGQRKLFASRREALSGQKGLLNARIAQTREQIAGIESQLNARSEQLDIAVAEREHLRPLREKGLVPMNRMSALDREIAELKGSLGQFHSETARLQGVISETRLQIIQIDEERQSEILTRHRDVSNRLATLQEQLAGSAERQVRQAIRAPRAGIVHASSVHTLGGVVPPGGVLMTIVPEDDALVLKAQVMPQDIDQIALGQLARVRLTAFDANSTPELIGTVMRIGADRSLDPITGQPHFEIRIAISEDEIAKLEGLELRPGLPAEVLITTGLRTAASYLLQPLTDNLNHAMRE